MHWRSSRYRAPTVCFRRSGPGSQSRPNPGCRAKYVRRCGPKAAFVLVTSSRAAVCITVGSAYVGSNPTPATRCENAPLAAISRAGGAFLVCPVVSPCSAVDRHIAKSADAQRTGVDAARTIGAYRFWLGREGRRRPRKLAG
jgi:hypothetical protein